MGDRGRLVVPAERLGVFRAGDPELRALAHFVHVYVDAQTRRPVPIPEAIRTAVEALPRMEP